MIGSFMGYFDNMGFIINRSIRGAKFIDIGFDTTRSIKGLKGMSLFNEVMSIVTIYSEKLVARLFRAKNLMRLIRNEVF